MFRRIKSETPQSFFSVYHTVKQLGCSSLRIGLLFYLLRSISIMSHLGENCFRQPLFHVRILLTSFTISYQSTDNAARIITVNSCVADSGASFK